MASKTLTINHADGGSETYTINRDKFAGVREMTVDGQDVSVDHTAVPKEQSRETTFGGSQTMTVKRDIEPLLDKVVGGAAAAYSLRDLNDKQGNSKVVNVRRGSDNEEREFTASGVNSELEHWVNGKLETTLPADVATSAAAYSLRKVKSDYTGNAARIRRTSDNVEVDVAFDDNDEVSDSSAITATSGSSTATTLGDFISGTDASVVIWYDQSGNGNHATQDTAGNQPSLVTSGSLNTRNGRPIIKFIQANSAFLEHSDLGMFPSGSDFALTVFHAMHIDSSSGGRIGVFGCNNGGNGPSTNGHRFGSGSSRRIAAKFKDASGSTTELTAGSYTDNSDSILTYKVALNDGSASLSAFNNGSLLQESTASITDQSYSIPSEKAILGARGTADNFSDSEFFEVIAFDSDQTNNRFKIESNINNHYGIYTTAGDGFVETWFDQSGNGNNADQTIAGSQPKIVENGSYLGELSFDGSNHTLSVATVSTLGIDGSNNRSAFAVARTTAGTDGFVIAGMAGGSSFQGLRYRSNSTNGLARAEISGFGVEVGDLSDGNNHVYSSIFGGTQTKDFDVSLDGSINQGSGTNVVNTDGTATFSVGTVVPNADAGFTREFILYASDQSANRPAIEKNINNYYEIY